MSGARLSPQEIHRILAEAEKHLAVGRLAECEAACRRVLATAPANPLANHYLGAVAFAVGQYDPAIRLLQRAAETDPPVAAFFGTLAEALAKLGRFDEALNAIRRAAELKPGELSFQYHHGALAGKLGRVDESIAALNRAIAIKPDFPGAINDLGLTLTSARRLDEALDCFRRALAADLDYRTAHDNIIYFSHFKSGIDGVALRKECEAWADRFAESLTRQAQPPVVDRASDRKLRIGYVSPDLYEHPVGRFMQPILAHHDRDAFEVVCYSDAAPDAVSRALQANCQQWRDTAGMSDEMLARRIRDDHVDILVDLSLHMGGNRLLVFARRPAPVQVTYLGYAGTSGMSAFDARLSDPHLDPPGNEAFYTEPTLRLSRSYWCYSRPPLAEQLGDVRPRDPGRPFTFACLNNIVKISDASLEAWAVILRELAGSRMIIQGEPGEHLAMMSGFFERAGVDPGRVEFAPKRSLLDYFRLYEQVDVALDAFPYAGGTTTCDALWMGVPVVTLAGRVAVHRGGVSVLTNLELEDLIANSSRQYCDIALHLARDAERVSSLRASLRKLMEASIVMSPTLVVRDLETALREIWQFPKAQ